MLLFQKILQVEDPQPYLKQRKDSVSAIVVENATLSWTKPDSLSDPPPVSDNMVDSHKVDENSQIETADTLPTLRNISFTLPKVCFTTDVNKLVNVEVELNLT